MEDILGQKEGFHYVSALLETFAAGHPVVLIADSRYAKFPYDLEQYMYVILGLYWIVDAWGKHE